MLFQKKTGSTIKEIEERLAKEEKLAKEERLTKETN